MSSGEHCSTNKPFTSLQQQNDPPVSEVKWNANIVLTKCHVLARSSYSHMTLCLFIRIPTRQVQPDSLRVKPFSIVTGSVSSVQL